MKLMKSIFIGILVLVGILFLVCSVIIFSLQPKSGSGSYNPSNELTSRSQEHHHEDSDSQKNHPEEDSDREGSEALHTEFAHGR